MNHRFIPESLKPSVKTMVTYDIRILALSLTGHCSTI